MGYYACALSENVLFGMCSLQLDAERKEKEQARRATALAEEALEVEFEGGEAALGGDNDVRRRHGKSVSLHSRYMLRCVCTGCGFSSAELATHNAYMPLSASNDTQMLAS